MSTVSAFSGSVLVTRGQQTVLRASTGLADALTGELCTAETRFQIASVSKQFTAAAVMLMVQEDAVDLSSPIAALLPRCASRWRDLTLHQLHTSGLGHWGDLPGFDVTRPGTPEEFLERFATVPLLSAPGQRWRYSSPGYLLAARVVEAVTGTAYASFLTERILTPAGMLDTSVGRAPTERVALGYRDGERVDAAQFAAIPGTGDVWSTVDDLVRYIAAFDAGDVLSAESQRLMVSRQVELDRPAQDTLVAADAYGYGYFLGTMFGHRARFHSGDNPGYQSFLGHSAETATTVVILSNDQETDLGDLLSQIDPVLV